MSSINLGYACINMKLSTAPKSKRITTNRSMIKRTFKDKGLIIIGVPSNDFGGQEPGSEETIKTFCRTKYDVSFLMTEKMSTRGKNQSDLFAFLTQSNPKLTGPVTWNFNKFLVSPDGKLINRPMSEKIISSIKPYILN